MLKKRNKKMLKMIMINKKNNNRINKRMYKKILKKIKNKHHKIESLNMKM